MPLNLSRRQFVLATAAAAGATWFDVPRIFADTADESRKKYGGFNMGLQSYSLRGFKVEKALDIMKDMQLHHVEFYSKHFAIDPAEAKIKAMKKLLKPRNITVSAHGVNGFGSNHEANRKIFLWPQNWLEPEFRDDKTHLFEELEGALLQGDVSSDLAEDAFLNYLKKLDELARLLRLDEPVRDPTRMGSEELMQEIQRVLKGLLTHGARLPKHLMLYVKNMLFIDGAIARVANVFTIVTGADGAGSTLDADLLLYGCDLAASSEGKALIERLASLTGADVAASSDATGAASLTRPMSLRPRSRSMICSALSFSSVRSSCSNSTSC